jgi:hypothetical protein
VNDGLLLLLLLLLLEVGVLAMMVGLDSDEVVLVLGETLGELELVRELVVAELVGAERTRFQVRPCNKAINGVVLTSRRRGIIISISRGRWGWSGRSSD